MSDYYEIVTKQVSEGEAFELDDREEVLDTLVHGSRIKVFVLSPVTFECGYVKDDGEPCEIAVSGPDERCHHHDNEDE